VKTALPGETDAAVTVDGVLPVGGVLVKPAR
jgi:hypothetical protein